MVAELSALAEAPPPAAGTAAGEVAARELDDEFSGDGDGEWELLLRCDPEAMREKAAAVAKRTPSMTGSSGNRAGASGEGVISAATRNQSSKA